MSNNKKIRAVTLIVGLFVLIFFIATNIYIGGLKGGVEKQRLEYASFAALKRDYLSARALYGSRIDGTNGSSSMAALFGSIEKDLGLSAKVKAARPLEGRIEGAVETNGLGVELSGLTLNELVNLLYRIENHGSNPFIRGFNMKESPGGKGLLDIKMEIARVKNTKGGGPRS